MFRTTSTNWIALFLLLIATVASATEATKPTTMTVGEMCGGCVTSITAKLKPMPGVADVACDIPKKTVTVTPAAGKTLSPRALWEAMEAIGKTPKSLVGPNGKFESKPKN